MKTVLLGVLAGVGLFVAVVLGTQPTRTVCFTVVSVRSDNQYALLFDACAGMFVEVALPFVHKAPSAGDSFRKRPGVEL